MKLKFVVYHCVAVEQALADYQQRYGCEPSVIIVPPTAQLQAPAGVAIEHNGGCLAGELWLPVPVPKGDDYAG